MSISNKTILDIKDRVDIVEVAQSLGIEVKKNFSLCVFHEDSNPSMSFKNGFFKCFSCGVRGDSFDLVKQVRNCSFREAVEILAFKTGVEIEIENESESSVKLRKDRKCFHESMMSLRDLFCRNLLKQENSFALMYLKNRKLSKETIVKFSIGYSKSCNDVYDFSDSIKNSSISIKNELKCPSNALNNRISIPIIDKSKNIVGFTFRCLDNSSPRYINTGNSVFFNKKMCFFAEHVAFREIKIKSCAVLVEGQFDAISLHEINVRNSLATQGTAFSNDSARRLKGMGVDKLIIFFDGDRAGVEAAVRAVSVCIENEIMPYVYPTEKDEDPSSMIEKGISIDFDFLASNSISGFDLLEKKNIVDQMNREKIKSIEYCSVSEIMSIKNEVVFLKSVKDTLRPKSKYSNIENEIMDPSEKIEYLDFKNRDDYEEFIILIKGALMFVDGNYDIMQVKNKNWGCDEFDLIWVAMINSIADKDAFTISDLSQLSNENSSINFIVDEIEKLDLLRLVDGYVYHSEKDVFERNWDNLIEASQI